MESEQPLAFGVVLSVDSATLLAADRVTNDLWLVDVSSPDVTATRVLRGDDRVRARLVAVSPAEREWRLLDRSGTLYRFERPSWRFLGQTAVESGPGTVMAGAADGAGGFAVLMRQPALENRARRDVVLLMMDGDGIARETWRSDPATSTGGASGSDMLSLSSSDSGWLIAGASPARVLHFDSNGTLSRQELFHAAPGRRLSREVREQFERLAAAAGLAGSARPPSYYPAVTALRQVGAGYLAVPLVGGATGEAEGLDWYCGLEYRATIFDSPDITQVLLLSHGVIVISETPDPAYTIDYYRLTDLPLKCEGRS